MWARIRGCVLLGLCTQSHCGWGSPSLWGQNARMEEKHRSLFLFLFCFFLVESLRLWLDFARNACRITSSNRSLIPSVWRKKEEIRHMWARHVEFLFRGSDHLFQLIHSLESSSRFCELCSSGFVQSWLFNFLDFYVTLLHYLPYCFLRYFHICTLLGFFFAHDLSNANKIISSQFLFQLNYMIFTYFYVFFHSFAAGFLPFLACCCCGGSWVQ